MLKTRHKNNAWGTLCDDNEDVDTVWLCIVFGIERFNLIEYQYVTMLTSEITGIDYERVSILCVSTYLCVYPPFAVYACLGIFLD